MKVILRQAVDNLGKAGDCVKVANGFARNFLIPKGFAYEESDANVKLLKKERELAEIRKNKDLIKAQDLAKHLRKMSCTIVKQVSEGDRLFGSVTQQDIVKALENEGIKLDKKQIILDEPIKSLGIYPVKIKLATEIDSVLKVWVVK
ncbi:50S ribosomal protein L9 [bacterium]|nr:50S ribosomal protein L9 [candidate division CSSED10-310 bacterium]